MALIPLKKPIPEFITNYVKTTFINPRCINASFFVKAAKSGKTGDISQIRFYEPCSIVSPSINYNEVETIFNLLRNIKNKKLKVINLLLLININLYFYTIFYYLEIN